MYLLKQGFIHRSQSLQKLVCHVLLLWPSFFCCSPLFYHSSIFCPFLNLFSLHVLPHCLKGSAMPWGGWVGADWIQLCPAWHSPGLFSLRPLQPPLTGPGHLHEIQWPFPVMHEISKMVDNIFPPFFSFFLIFLFSFCLVVLLD